MLEKLDILLERLLSKCCGPRAKKGAEPVLDPDSLKGGVERISLASQVHREGFRSLFQQTTIQEPTFKELVLVYRINSGRDDLHVSANRDAIYIKVFRDIPHADLELIFPCKSTGLRALDILKFVGAGIVGVISILMQRQAGELAGYSALFGFVGLLITVLFNYQYQMSVYQYMTLGNLFMKTKDSDEGAIGYIMEEVVTQEVKEAFLGYWFLLKSQESLSQEELDEVVENFLQNLQESTKSHKECKIDFEVDDALGKLKALQVIDEPEPGKFIAVPLEEAVHELTTQWEGLIAAVE